MTMIVSENVVIFDTIPVMMGIIRAGVNLLTSTHTIDDDPGNSFLFGKNSLFLNSDIQSISH